MPPHNLINVESRIILGPLNRLQRDKGGRLSHLLHNNIYGVILSPSPRKTNHEVHVNVLPFPSWNLNHLSEISSLKVVYLNLLTIRTLVHILINVLLNAIPPIDLLEVMIQLGGTYMYRIPGTMGLFNNLSLQIIHIWYTQPVLDHKFVITFQSKDSFIFICNDSFNSINTRSRC